MGHIGSGKYVKNDCLDAQDCVKGCNQALVMLINCLIERGTGNLVVWVGN